MQKGLIIILFIFCFTYRLSAQQVRPAASSEIHQELLRLNNLVNVLYFAAHPDDENTRLLAWLVNGLNVRTAYLSLTRGDGGQNILGREQGAALGLIRTYELLEARKIDGAEQFFTRAVDFGFSKNSDETFRHWNPDVLTADAVWTIRNFRPDIVICRFPPDARAGHGQHAASAIIAARAFKAAGDNKQYADQLKYIQTWQPERLLFNTFRFGSLNTTAGNQFKVKTGQYKPELGMGYGELSGISRSVHKSQGAGTPNVPGTQMEYFELVDGQPLSSSLFDGIDISWNRVGRQDIGMLVNKILSGFDYKNPAASLPALLALRKQIKGVKDRYWQKEKLQELDKIILDCSGFMAELYSRQPEAVAGSSLPFTLNVIARPTVPVVLKSVYWIDGSADLNATLTDDSLYSFEHKLTIPSGTPLTEPYWLSKPGADAAHYSVPSDSVRGLPEAPPLLTGILHLLIGDEDLTVKVPLSYKRLDPVKGDVVEALRIVPAATISFTQPLILTLPGSPVQADLRIHAFSDLNNASLLMDNNKPAALTGIDLKAGTDTVVTVSLPAQKTGQQNSSYILEAAIDVNGKIYNKAQHVIRYTHIPTLQYFTPATAKILPQNWKCTATRVAFIEGAGDYTVDFLRQAGLTVDVLKDEDFISAAKLKQYDAIISGVRAVNTEKRMKYWLPVLFRYVQEGGTLIMQYNTLQDLSATAIGPYPFTLSNLRVTEEDAQVKFTNAQHRLLNYPNKISNADFSGWVQERGLNFPSSWDNHYEPLFEMNDRGEEALQGSTLYTRYGKGHYIYTSLSFFRQLPAGNTGAVRLLMNMLSVGK